MPAELAACFVMQAHCLNARDALHPGSPLQALDPLCASCQHSWQDALSCRRMLECTGCIASGRASARSWHNMCAMPAELAACFVMQTHCLNARDALHPDLPLQARRNMCVIPAELAACFVMQAHCLNVRDALHPGLPLQALDTYYVCHTSRAGCMLHVETMKWSYKVVL